MATYAIGDVQGCFAACQALLAKINFDPQKDTLWFTGDLINRGPQSLEMLRFVKGLGGKHISVLGNHDLHLLAVASGVRAVHKFDTLETILKASDCDELLDWLRYRPLFHHDAASGFAMAHAGLAPAWNLAQAKSLAKEVEQALQGNSQQLFLQEMYGNQPDKWADDLQGMARLRCITNYFTRMRFCYADGRLDLEYKGDIANKPVELTPWFDLPQRVNRDIKIIFGHWAALGGVADAPNVYALDTGCVWGNCLTALRLEDGVRFSVACG